MPERKSIMNSITAMAIFTELLKTGDVEQHMDEIKECCNHMENDELKNIVLELITSIFVNCRLSIYTNVFEDAAIELDEKYDKKYDKNC